ncbi:MAG: ATP-grasp domain-containing protein [Candidatus Kerfeldbacteria bacterium]
MKFYLISSESNSQINDTFVNACKKNNEVDLIYVDIRTYPEKNFKKPTTKDALYRANTTPYARQIEIELLNEKVATFYTDYRKALHGGMNAAADEKIYIENGVPTPKTIFIITKDKKNIESQIQDLNGPPYIVKVSGKSHGVGVMKVDSIESLFSVLDYLRNDEAKVMIREYIPVTSSARLVVLGDKVIDSIEYQAPKDDFRSNVGNPKVITKKFPKDIKDTAIKAVQLLNLEFGGVDILIHNNKHYLTEVNYPCFFPRAQQITGTDIAAQMIEYLYNKQNK